MGVQLALPYLKEKDCVFVNLECAIYIYRRCGSFSMAMLHRHVSTVAQDGQTNCRFSYVPGKEGVEKVFAIYKLTAR